MTTKPTTPEKGITPLSLDTSVVGNWDSSTPASTVNPDASLLNQLSWLHAQVGEINDLLWGFIPLDSVEAQARMGPPLCHFIESRTTVMVRLLNHLCQALWDAERATTVEG